MLYVVCRCSATEVLPQPAGPVMTHMCLDSCEDRVGGAVVAEVEVIFPVLIVVVAASEGGVGGRCEGEVVERGSVRLAIAGANEEVPSLFRQTRARDKGSTGQCSRGSGSEARECRETQG